MLEGLDAVDWTSLEHAYGDASDVPDLLRDLGEGQESAFDALWGNAFHQGTRYSVSPVIVPFLVEILVARRDEDDRAHAITRGILEYLHGLAMGYPTDLFPRPIDPDAWEAQIAGVDPGRWRERAPGEAREPRRVAPCARWLLGHQELPRGRVGPRRAPSLPLARRAVDRGRDVRAARELSAQESALAAGPRHGARSRLAHAERGAGRDRAARRGHAADA